MQRKRLKVLVQPKFAVVCARGLGDALISMTLAHNLKRSGYPVTTFSTILCELKEWFPGHDIRPFPNSDKFLEIFSRFDTVIAADHSLINQNLHLNTRSIILKEQSFDKTLSMVQNLQQVCKERLSLPHAHKDNGITPPYPLTFRRHPNRIVIHPVSSDVKKNWPPHKFIALANALEKEGFCCFFCVSPQEREQWQDKVNREALPFFEKVDKLAAFLYESGYLIGNDSGLGHLASSLGIPTLSLFARAGYARLWRPGWGAGKVIAPPPVLIGSRLKQKYWQKLLSVKRVKKQFKRLREETLAHPSLTP